MAMSVGEAQIQQQPRQLLPVYMNRMFTMVWAGGVLSTLGDGFASVALGLWVLRATGSALAMAQIMVVRALVSIFVGPVAGGLADRVDRRRLAVVCDVSRSLVFFLIAYLMIGSSHVPIFSVALLLGISTAFSAAFDPAMQASTVMMVGKEHTGAANSLLQMSRMMGGILGPLLGGVIFVAVGGYICMVINAVSFLLSALCLILAGHIPSPSDHAGPKSQRPNFWATLLEGARFLVRDPLVGVFVFVLTPMIVFFQSGIGVLFPTMAVVVWKTSGIMFGLLSALFAAGFVIGFFILMKVSDKLRYRGIAFGMALLLSGFLLALMGRLTNPLGALPILLAIGMVLSLTNVVLQVVLQTKVPPEMQGRVYGVVQAAFSAATPLALVLAGFLSDRFGPAHMTVAAGLSFTLVGLVAFSLPAVRRFQ
jgi:DHA3 family macrolide efflux protein-like MFS transporter